MKNKKQLLSMLLLATCNVWGAARPHKLYDQPGIKADKNMPKYTSYSNATALTEKQSKAIIDGQLKNAKKMVKSELKKNSDKDTILNSLHGYKKDVDALQLSAHDKSKLDLEYQKLGRKTEGKIEKKADAAKAKEDAVTAKENAAKAKKEAANAKKNAKEIEKANKAAENEKAARAKKEITFGASSVKLPFFDKTVRIPGTKIKNADIVKSEAYSAENITAKKMSQDNQTLETSFKNIQKVRSKSDIENLDKYLADIKQKYDGLIGDTVPGARPVNETTLFGKLNGKDDAIKSKEAELTTVSVNSPEGRTISKELEKLRIERASIQRKYSEANFNRKSATEKQDAIKEYKNTDDYRDLQSKGKGATSTQPIGIAKKSAETKPKEMTVEEDPFGVKFGPEDTQVTPPVSASSAVSTNSYNQITRQEPFYANLPALAPEQPVAVQKLVAPTSALPVRPSRRVSTAADAKGLPDGSAPKTAERESEA